MRGFQTHGPRGGWNQSVARRNRQDADSTETRHGHRRRQEPDTDHSDPSRYPSPDRDTTCRNNSHGFLSTSCQRTPDCWASVGLRASVGEVRCPSGGRSTSPKTENKTKTVFRTIFTLKTVFRLVDHFSFSKMFCIFSFCMDSDEPHTVKKGRRQYRDDMR